MLMSVEQEYVMYLRGIWSRGHDSFQTESTIIAIDRKGGAMPYPDTIIGAVIGRNDMLNEAFIHVYLIVSHIHLFG